MQFRFLIGCFLYIGSIWGEAAVTYDFSGGRFGDNVLAYLHTKWLSYHYQIPLLYKPFRYSAELNMDDMEIRYDDARHKYSQELKLSAHIPNPFDADCIFVCPYFPEIEWELRKEYYFTFPVDWKNKEWRKIAKEMISFKGDRQLTYPPQDMLSVAIHMREGGDFDDEEHKIKHPLKTPPITFYIDSLKMVLDLCKDKMIYCHLFTDALQPESWVDKIVQALPKDAPIVFNYRKENNRHDSNVLEDFFSLFNFDILIRAESNFSIVPGLIHDYAIVCYPKTYSINDRSVTIDHIHADIDEEYLKICQDKYEIYPSFSNNINKGNTL